MPDSPDQPPPAPRRLLAAAFFALASLAAVGCQNGGTASLVETSLEPSLADDEPAGAVGTFADAAPSAGAVALAGAGNEWLDFVAVCSGDATAVRVGPLRTGGGSPREAAARVYRVADVPADLNHAGHLRLHGGDGRVTALPRVLIPLRRDGDRFALPPGGGKLWVDLQLPAGLPRGAWAASLDALGPGGGVLATLPITVQSHGFDLPPRPRLAVTAALTWDRLAALWPDRFGGVSPTQLSRDDPKTRPAVERLDELVALARDHRVLATVPDVAPVVKWPAGRLPDFYWDDYDALVTPWLDAEGVAAWPAPRMAHLGDYSDSARREYWQAVLSHLDGLGVLEASVVRLDDDLGESQEAQGRDGGLSLAERLRVSAAAGRVARAYGVGALAVPLEGDQVRFTGVDNPSLFPPDEAGRLMIRGEGLVTDRPSRPWPAGLPEPLVWLDTDGPTPAPAAGPGAARSDVRLWGWLAFLRGATLLDVGDALPPTADATPIDPTRIVWFYPGDRFGHDGPVAGVQLKWLRRAEQDFEYLLAAAERLEEPYARVIARALVRPVRAGPGQAVSPLLPLIAGTPGDADWRQGLALVAEKVAIADKALRRELPPRFVTDHTNRTTAWLYPRERPAAVVTATRWDLTRDETATDSSALRLFLRTDVSVYNPSDARPEGAALAFQQMPGGDAPGRGPWRSPGTVEVPPVETYEVGRFALGASADADDLGGQFALSAQAPMRVSVRDGGSGATSTAEAVTPAAVIDERPVPPHVDGLLGEWSGNEAILDGPMVLMQNRPALQSGRVAREPEPAQAFVAWTAGGLHVAFKLPGVPADRPMRRARNFVETEFGRVWGEDACELLVQPVWLQSDDPVPGPLLLVVCKPDGAFARRRGDRRREADPWRNFESGLRYAATTDPAGVWRAEATIPWDALRAAGWPEAGSRPDALPAVPAMLRFNLSHHDGQSGRSASWAGPVDFGSDDSFTGAVVLRRPTKVGFAE